MESVGSVITNCSGIDSIYQDPQVKQIVASFTRKIPTDDTRYIERLTTEFKLVKSKNFFKVFLQVKEILELSIDIPHIIRGSAGSSLICYLMNITNIDPIKEQISLARFMHEQRKDTPDIDIDFPWNKRDLILKKIHQHWPRRVARISNHIHYKEKSAIRQALREDGYKGHISRDEKLEDLYQDEIDQFRILERAKELEGTFRCHSLHCGGIVIFDKEVPEHLFLKKYNIVKRDKNDLTTGDQIWLDKDEVEKYKYIKIDILSNRGLGQLWDISKRPIEDYPDQDVATAAILTSGNNFGLIYAESRGLYKIFKHIKPKCIKDVAEALALIRPAAAGGGQKSDFLRDYTCLLQSKQVTKKREDYIIYDDDAIHYLQRLLKIDESSADLFRKAFSKNKKVKKEEFKVLLKKSRPDLLLRERSFIFEQLERLEEYSFCKSHAYSYAKLVWALAYQKTHNPKKFWVAAINNANSTYRRWVYFREAHATGIKLNLGPRTTVWTLNREDQLIGKDAVGFRFGKINHVNDYFKYGYWIGKDFLPGMYYKTTTMTRLDYYKTIRKDPKTLDKLKNKDETLNIGYFRGIIAVGRPYRSNKITEGGKIEYKKGRVITFLTVGYEDTKYLDLVLWGSYAISKMHCIEGEGVIKTDLGGCQVIEVTKFKFSRLE